MIQRSGFEKCGPKGEPVKPLGRRVELGSTILMQCNP